MERLCPDLRVESIFDIDLGELKKHKIKGLIIDLDNTAVKRESSKACDKSKDWIIGAKNVFENKVCILSNNTKRRGQSIAEFDFEIRLFPRAFKPRKKGFKNALKHLGLRPEEVAGVGDQLFTDIWGGNRMGMFTVLVLPLSKNDGLQTRFLRRIESFILRNQAKKQSPKTIDK